MQYQTLRWRKKNKRRTLYCIALVAFVFGLFSIGAGWGMRMDPSGMRDCVFTRGGGQGLCPMQIADHLTDWRMLFGSVPQSELLVIMLAALTLGVVACTRLIPLSTPILIRILWYDRAKVHRKLFAPLQRALASGIAHPKIYA